MLPYPPFEVAKFLGRSTPEVSTKAIDSLFHGTIISSKLPRRLVLLLKNEEPPMAAARTSYCSSAYFTVSSRQPRCRSPKVAKESTIIKTNLPFLFK